MDGALSELRAGPSVAAACGRTLDGDVGLCGTVRPLPTAVDGRMWGRSALGLTGLAADVALG